MLILILIDVQYLQNAVLSFEKFVNRQNHSSSSSHHLVKKSPQQCSLFFDTKSGELLKFEMKMNSNFILKLGSEHLQIYFNQITRRIYWTAYCIVLFFSIQHFWKLGVFLNDLVVKVLDSQSRSLMVKTNGWLQGRFSLSSFWGW